MVNAIAILILNFLLDLNSKFKIVYYDNNNFKYFIIQTTSPLHVESNVVYGVRVPGSVSK